MMHGNSNIKCFWPIAYYLLAIYFLWIFLSVWRKFYSLCQSFPF